MGGCAHGRGSVGCVVYGGMGWGGSVSVGSRAVLYVRVWLCVCRSVCVVCRCVCAVFVWLCVCVVCGCVDVYVCDV